MRRKLSLWTGVQAGQGFVEYILLILLLALTVVGGLAATGTSVNDLYGKVVEAFGGDIPVLETPEPYPNDRITVKVVDAEGEGIANVRVYVFRGNGSYAGKSGRTNADGLVEFTDMADGSYKFRADYQSNRYWSSTVTWPGQHFVVIQTGQRPFPVKVIDAAGNGIASVRVYAYTSRGSWTGKYGNTGSDGVVTLDMADGSFKFRAYYQGQNYWSEVVSLPGASSATIKTGQGPFPVKVVDAAGNGIANVRVYAYTSRGSWTGKYGNTGNDGIVTLDMADGSFKFRAYYQGQNYWSEVVSLPGASSATIKTGQGPFPVKVIDAAGNGIANVRVYAYTSRGSWTGKYGNTGSDGIVTLEMADGNFKFRAYYQGHNLWSEPVTIPGASSATIKTGRQGVNVFVVDESGNPQANARLYVYSSSGSYTGVWAQTGVDGKAKVALVNGTFRVRAIAGGKNYWSGTVTIPGTSEIKIVVK